MNAVNKAFISTFVQIEDLRELVTKKTLELFKAAGIDMPVEDIRFEELDNDVYLYLDCFNNLPAQTQYERDMVQAATDIGFSDMGYENMRLVCEHIYDTQVDHTFDPNASGVVIEFHQQPSEIMAKIDNLYNEIDNMTAKEAKQAVAELYAHLKKTYGWGE